MDLSRHLAHGAFDGGLARNAVSRSDDVAHEIGIGQITADRGGQQPRLLTSRSASGPTFSSCMA